MVEEFGKRESRGGMVRGGVAAATATTGASGPEEGVGVEEDNDQADIVCGFIKGQGIRERKIERKGEAGEELPE